MCSESFYTVACRLPHSILVCQNILHVHARRHPQKRLYVKDEDNPHSFIGEKNDDFQQFLKLSKENIQKLITGQGKFKEYQDLKNILEK